MIIYTKSKDYEKTVMGGTAVDDDDSCPLAESVRHLANDEAEMK